jgi:hypothetical protein
MYDHIAGAARDRRIAYKTWYHMHARCKQHPAYLNIHVCKEWSDFEVFYKDMGVRPSDQHSLDRVENALVYSKSTCRWATLEEQNGNRPGFTIDLLYNGEKTNLKALCRQLNLNYMTVYKRLRAGKSINEIFGVRHAGIELVKTEDV